MFYDRLCEDLRPIFVSTLGKTGIDFCCFCCFSFLIPSSSCPLYPCFFVSVHLCFCAFSFSAFLCLPACLPFCVFLPFCFFALLSALLPFCLSASLRLCSSAFPVSLLLCFLLFPAFSCVCHVVGKP